jgi:beta-lactamase class A
MRSIKVLFVITMCIIPMLSPGQDTEQLKSNVRSLLDTVQGTFAVAFIPPSGGGGMMINEKVMFHAASTMKTPVMIEVFRQIREGRFALDDSLEVRNEFKSIVDGSPYQLDLNQDSDDSMYKRVGSKASVRELLVQMITVSSNLATNILIGRVDARNVTATMRTLGANDIEVLRGVEDGKAFEKGLNNRTSAFDLALIMKSISDGKAVDQSASEAMMDILLAQKFCDIIPALLPQGVRVAHKTGSITGVEHDSGIVLLPDGRKYVLVLLSKDLKDAASGKAALAQISKRVYDFVIHGK